MEILLVLNTFIDNGKCSLEIAISKIYSKISPLLFSSLFFSNDLIKFSSATGYGKDKQKPSAAEVVFSWKVSLT